MLTYNERTELGMARDYIDDDLERHSRSEKVKEAAARLVQLMEFQCDNRSLSIAPDLDGKHIASVVNLATDAAGQDEDCMVVSREDIIEMRDYAVAMFKVLDEIVATVDSKKIDDKYGKISDIIKDAGRFDSDYGSAMLNMPQIVKNVEA